MATGKEEVRDEVLEEGPRYFEYEIDGEEKKFFLAMPTSEQIRKAEWHYSKVYNKALIEGVATTPEMMDILTDRGLYGPKYEEKLRDLQVNITLKIAEMHNTIDDEDKEELAREVQELRDELYRWNQRLTGPLSNSCEQMAEDAEVEYLTSAMVQDEKGNPVWGSYDAFISEGNQGLALKSRFEVLLWMQGLDADFLDNTPENKVLRELALQKAEAEAEAAKKPAQLEAAEEEKKPAKKKPGRKKKTTKKKAAAAE
jgi:hypothetical protein